MTRARVRRIGPVALAFCLLSLGIWQLGAAGLIHAKAWLAQALLEDAWHATLAGESRVRPWPWADTYPIAKLVAPGLGVERVLLAGASGRSLAFAPGHLDGTAAPGAPGHSVVTAHRDTHFHFLFDVALGDRLGIQRPDGGWQVYRVTDLQVVDARVARLVTGDERASLTLVTCYPASGLGLGGPLRYVVHAQAVAPAHEKMTHGLAVLPSY